jgi:high mobility group protein B1|mmetsp:Transcript_110341/g.173853  ORF Transcript_110341/g.173853 Transcript_110341/m.173853 type:complete len:326 (-) Transcript_110341:196-1173(-)
MTEVATPPKPSHSVAAASPALTDSATEAWKQFTPDDINSEKCLARLWGDGLGAQCNHAPATGSEFCTRHKSKDAWKTHGRVDGPIPEKKLKEFLKAGKTTSKVRDSHSRESKVTPTKRRAASADLSTTPDTSKLKKPCGGAFGVYRSQNMASIKASLLAKREESTMSSIAKEAALLWKDMSVEQRKEFQDAYNAKKDAYKATKKKLKVKRVVLAKPDGTPLKRPLNPYGLFLKERRESIKASLPANHRMTDVGKEAGLLWKALSEDERTSFRERSGAEMATYKEAALMARKAESAKAKAADPRNSNNVLAVQKPRIRRLRRKKAW